jgi:LacI family transcriptional regulator
MTVKWAPDDPAAGITLDRSSAVPIARQLEDQLTWLIATGTLAPGERLPSIRQFGAALGIHHHTVRQAYQELNRRGLIEIHQGAATTVREFSGLRLARPRSTTAMTAWGVLVPGHTPFYLPFLQEVERVAGESRALTVISVTEDNHVKAKFQMREMIAAGVRGIIAASLGELVEEEFKVEGQAAAIPVVYCDQPLQSEESIVFDDAGAGYELAAHLARDGRRSVTFMTPSLEFPNMAALHHGFLRAAGEGLIDAVEVIPCADFTVEAGKVAAEAALTGVKPPTAIATTADELALGVLAAARRLGVRVPDDLALVSYGAIDVTEYAEPPITTVALPGDVMGELAARRLVARIDGAPADGKTTLPPRLLVRASCGPHASEQTP